MSILSLKKFSLYVPNKISLSIGKPVIPVEFGVVPEKMDVIPSAEQSLYEELIKKNPKPNTEV